MWKVRRWCVNASQVLRGEQNSFMLTPSIVWNSYSTQWGLGLLSQAGSTAALALLGECGHLNVIDSGYRAGLSIWDFSPEGIKTWEVIFAKAFLAATELSTLVLDPNLQSRGHRRCQS